jgi:SAM-dependent methyltransferase
MSVDFHPVADRQAVCKCCGSPTSLYGVVDFHKNCNIHQHKVLDVSGIPIYYYRCPQCGFLFTTAFDHFAQEDFHRHVYNADYLLVDPDYRESRPRGNAALICQLFPTIKPRRILDYGSGEGLLAEVLRGTGLFEVDSFDPFVPQRAARPPHRYDCIVSFEVLEHSTDPVQTMADMNSFLTNDGLILLSTLLQPADIDQQGLNWWYAGPRNGHVSLFSRASLLKLVQPFEFTHAWFNDNLHVLFRRVPAFAQHFIRI